ncbi:hypothetical protein AVEN_106413-1 [Araneus ventricosus]|uniref:Uncharacterized protein n=1 Tax=Araneus ventricosus TaxID=182803 RepID=A0A4Y2AUF5_ARAVE|nr:hypothetical protein AVEN_106413-1 [Araneus ventricosus]
MDAGFSSAYVLLPVSKRCIDELENHSSNQIISTGLPSSSSFFSVCPQKAYTLSIAFLRFPSREQRSHEEKSAVPFDIGGKQQDSCTWTSLTRRAQEKGLHTEGRHNAEESITVSEHISGTLWCHP